MCPLQTWDAGQRGRLAGPGAHHCARLHERLFLYKGHDALVEGRGVGFAVASPVVPSGRGDAGAVDLEDPVVLDRADKVHAARKDVADSVRVSKVQVDGHWDDERPGGAQADVCVGPVSEVPSSAGEAHKVRARGPRDGKAVEDGPDERLEGDPGDVVDVDGQSDDGDADSAGLADVGLKAGEAPYDVGEGGGEEECEDNDARELRCGLGFVLKPRERRVRGKSRAR